MPHFEHALKKLIEDAEYRGVVSEDWNRLTDDYELEPNEMLLLMQVWHATDQQRAWSPIDMCHCCCSTLAD